MEIHSNQEKFILSLFERNESQTGLSFVNDWQARIILLLFDIKISKLLSCFEPSINDVVFKGAGVYGHKQRNLRNHDKTP